MSCVSAPVEETDLLARHSRLLGEALPFVQALRDQTLIVGILGGILGHEAQRAALMQDIALLTLLGARLVIVHGEHTNDPNGPAHLMQIRTDLVHRLWREGIRAVGLDGQDARCVTLDEADAEALGKIVIDTTLMSALNDLRMVPVVSACAPDRDGQFHLLPPERLATLLAQRLHAASLLLVSEGKRLDKAGIKAGVTRPRPLADWLAIHDDPETCAEIRAALEAADKGVATVHLVDAGQRGALVAELMTPEGIGTVLCQHDGTQVLADASRYFNDADSVIHSNYVAEPKWGARF